MEEYRKRLCEIAAEILHVAHELDTADVRENVRGEWVFPYDTTTMVCKCSVCGMGGNKKYNYCPNCGAYTRGEKE